MAMTVHNMDHVALVYEPEMLGIPMRAYDPVPGWPGYETRNLEMDWAPSQSASVRTVSAQGEARRLGMIVQWYEGGDHESTNIGLPGISGSTQTINLKSEIPMDPDG